MSPRIFVAIPALDELATLPQTMEALALQSCRYNFSVYVCVNQPDEWWNNPEKLRICEENRQLLDYLSQFDKFELHVMDRSSRGHGWTGRDHGVGMARKVLFDNILHIADDDDIIVSLDSDTLFEDSYLQAIGDRFRENEKLNAVSMPYYHKLTADDEANRAILRYELYMRCYYINMSLIESPYTFTAIGSAIAMRVRALRKIGGITPVKSGEDFYLLQKLRKMDYVSNWCGGVAFPAARFSERVFFGTGPAMVKGRAGNWESYPIYHHCLFQEIKHSYDLIPQLFSENITTDFITFLENQFHDVDLWSPLRKNATSVERFSRAFHEKADGLRILQYLKQKQKNEKISDEVALKDNFLFFFKKMPDFLENLKKIDDLSTNELNFLRNLLFEFEQELRFREYKTKE